MKLYKVTVHESCLGGFEPTLPPMFYVAETDDEFVKDRIDWAYQNEEFYEPLENEPETPENMSSSEEDTWNETIRLLRKQAYRQDIINAKEVDETYRLTWIDQVITAEELDVLQRLGIITTNE